ncbi:MAG TPA: M14-type cytosolic carboxypeptidase, partial [Bryobacteraceae bacterium]
MILLLASVALATATIHTNFEGGSLGEIKKISDTHFRLAVTGESDQDHRNRQANWYYFRVDDASQALTLDIVNLPGEYNYKPNRGAITKDTPPVISYDGVHWEHVKTYQYDPVEPKLILRISPSKSTFWIAHCPPYTDETLAKLRNEIGNHPDFREEKI